METPPQSSPGLTEETILAFLMSHAAEALELPGAEVDRITTDTRIVEGLQLDSLRQVVLVTGVEERFGFEFEPEELMALGSGGTVGDLVRMIQRRAGTAPVS
jgi:acyl carrier protein